MRSCGPHCRSMCTIGVQDPAVARPASLVVARSVFLPKSTLTEIEAHRLVVLVTPLEAVASRASGQMAYELGVRVWMLDVEVLPFRAPLGPSGN